MVELRGSLGGRLSTEAIAVSMTLCNRKACAMQIRWTEQNMHAGCIVRLLLPIRNRVCGCVVWYQGTTILIAVLLGRRQDPRGADSRTPKIPMYSLC